MRQEKILILKSQQQEFINLLEQEGIDAFSVEKQDEQNVYVVFKCTRAQLFNIGQWVGVATAK